MLRQVQTARILGINAHALTSTKAKNVISNYSPRFMVWVDVLRRVIELEPYWDEFLTLYKQKNPNENVPAPFTAAEIATIKSVLPLLRDFQHEFYEMEGETKPLMSEYYPKLQRILGLLTRDPLTEAPILTKLKQTLEKLMLKYFQTDDLKLPALIAAFLDPRFGPAFIEEVNVEGRDRWELIESHLVEHALAILRHQVGRSKRSQVSATIPTIDGMELNGSMFQIIANEHNGLQARAAASSPSSAGTMAIPEQIDETATRVAVMTEFQKYRTLHTKIKFDTKNYTTLEYWAEVQKLYPHLARAAQLFLAIPVTSASVERNFSASKALLSPQRRAMNEETLASLTLLRRRSKAGKTSKKRKAETELVVVDK